MHKRDDNARVVAARMLAESAIIHPEAHADIRAKAEDAVISGCTTSRSQRERAALFAAVGSTKTSKRCASGPTRCSAERRQQPPLPREWEIAQKRHALRRAG